MHSNHTTPHVVPLKPKADFPGYYLLILVVLLILAGCVVAVVVYIRRRSRSAELRHRLIPVYSYDPTEVQEDLGDTGWGEEEDLAKPLYKDETLSFPSAYGT